jgi:alpha,alpha-trehalose phosphorylase
MAQRNLRAAAEAAQHHPARAAQLGVDTEEVASWRDAAEAVVIPYDPDIGVHSQAEEFTQLDVWDFAGTGADKYPLFLHFSYFDLYRKQVVKQADLVLALHLCGDAFTDEEKARDFHYYEALTVRDSSLSACTQAVVAAEVGHLELAYDYFREATLIDLDDLEHNTRDGLHIASLAGAWVAAVAGFGGLRDHGGALSFKPRLPPALTRLAFGLACRGCELRVEFDQVQASYTLGAGSTIDVTHHGEPITVTSDAPVTRAIPPLAPREPPRQPHGRAPG